MASLARLRPHEMRVTPFRAGDVDLAVWSAPDLDALLDRLIAEQGEVRDDDIPYSAHLWPAALVLAREVAQGPDLAGVTALELGCGVGLVGLAAAARGAHVTLTDLQPGAVDLATRNAHDAGLDHRVKVQSLDWRAPDHAPVDLLLGSDVLYEARFVAPVASALRALLKPGGVAWLADPDRPHLPGWVDHARGLGLDVRPGPSRTHEDGVRVHLLSVSHGPGTVRPAPWERPMPTAPHAS